MAQGWILGIIIGYLFFNLGLWKSDSSPKPQDTAWAFAMLGGAVLMFLSVLLWAVPNFFEASPVKWFLVVGATIMILSGPLVTTMGRSK